MGNHIEVNEELEQITPQLLVHPDVLEVRWQIYSIAKKWEACIDIAQALIKLEPDRLESWLHRSYSLHELKRTEEAHDLLLPAIEKFPDDWEIPYNLACYTAQLGRIDESERWFKIAMTLDEKAVQQTAIDDPDLEPLWESRSGSNWKRGEYGTD